MPNTLGAGSGRPDRSPTFGDFSVAGVVTRVMATSPADADWGGEVPPDGTLVVERGTAPNSGPPLLWVRAGGAWFFIAPGE